MSMITPWVHKATISAVLYTTQHCTIVTIIYFIPKRRIMKLHLARMLPRELSRWTMNAGFILNPMTRGNNTPESTLSSNLILEKYYTGRPIKKRTAYFLQYVDRIISIGVRGNLSWEKGYQNQQFWFSSLFSMAHFVRQCRVPKFPLLSLI